VPDDARATLAPVRGRSVPRIAIRAAIAVLLLLAAVAGAGGADLLGGGEPARPAGAADSGARGSAGAAGSAGSAASAGSAGAPGAAGAAGAADLRATVERVVDGDTVVLRGLGRSRLIGVDTPEVHGRRECFGEQASAYAERMLRGRRVRYAIGAEPRDRYGRALVHVWLPDGRFFNELLVAGGYARTLEIAPNVRYARRLRRRADEAHAAGRGLWSLLACP
jgi:micrococcal nuclease